MKGNLREYISTPLRLKNKKMGSTNFDEVDANIVKANQFIGASVVTQGNIFYVKPYSGHDGADGKSPATAVKTLTRALALTTANHNDVVYLFAESNTAANTFEFLSAAFDWNKDGVHLIGVGAGPFIGSRAGVRNSTTVTTIEDLFTVSANNCLIENINFFQGDVTSTATSPRALVASGMRNKFVNCQISGNGDTGGSMDTSGARSLAVLGAENTFQHCYIGLDTVIRGTQTAEVTIGNIARTTFENCMFNSYTSLSTFKAVTYTAPDRFVKFKNCEFNAIQNITSAVAPTGALAAATSVNGQIIVNNSPVFGYADVSTADDTKILVYGSGNGTLVGLGLAGTVDVA
jgi:hypothetical protein